jgi:hypothetical protein
MVFRPALWRALDHWGGLLRRVSTAALRLSTENDPRNKRTSLKRESTIVDEGVFYLSLQDTLPVLLAWSEIHSMAQKTQLMRKQGAKAIDWVRVIRVNSGSL